MENGEGEGMAGRACVSAGCAVPSGVGSPGPREAQGSVGKAVCQWAAGETGRENGKAIGKGRRERKSEREKVRLRLYSNDKRTQLLQSEFLRSCNRGGNVGDVETIKRSNKAYCKPY